MADEERAVDLSQAFEGFGEDYRHAGLKVIVTDNFGPRIKIKQVTATDIPPVLALTQSNLALNAGLFAGTYTAHELDWTNASHRTALAGPYDIVLMSDLFYMPVSPNLESRRCTAIDPFRGDFSGN